MTVAVRIGLAFAAGAFALAFAGPVVARISALHELASGPSSYFVPSHALLLYGAGPLAALGSIVLFLLPGGLLVAGAGRPRSFAELVVLAFGASLVLDVVLVTVAGLAFGPAARPSVPRVLWPAATVAALGWLALRARRGALAPASEDPGGDRRRLLGSAAAVLLAAAILVPKLYWENFNLDGIEAFEFGRSLEHHVAPRWLLSERTFGFYPNFVLFAYPNHWFLELVGPVEAAARLPYLLWLAVLFAGLVALIESGRAGRLGGREEAALGLALGAFTVVQAFDVNYEPFFCDLAETGATDTLQIACFVAAAWALFSERRAWFPLFGLLTYAAAPGGLLLLGALAAGTWLEGSSEGRARARRVVACAALCLAVGLVHDLASWLSGPAGENQFSAKNLLRRLFPPTVTEVARWNALLFPSGILPALSLVFVRRRDPVAFPVAIVTALYFGVLYVQAWAAVHQFTPVMVLPLVVFWRLYLDAPRSWQTPVLAAVVVTTTLAGWLSLPRHLAPNTAIRDVGRATAFRVGDYHGDYERAARAAWTVEALFPADYRLAYPEQPWGTDAFSWMHYAAREKPPDARIRYVVQPSDDPVPATGRRVASREGVSVFVLDEAAWRRDRAREIPRVVTSPLYEPVLRNTFRFFRRFAGEAAGNDAGPKGAASGILHGQRPEGGES